MKTSLIIGLLTVCLSFFDHFDWLRIFIGHSYVFLFSGWAVASSFWPKKSILERIIVSSLLSLLLTYPASILVTVIEGQSTQAIFSRHLQTSMIVLFTLSQLLTLTSRIIHHKIPHFSKNSTPEQYQPSKLLLLALVIYSILTFTRLGYADVYGDEYDIGYQAYNLVDGIQAGRKAYVISFSIHPPLSASIKHFSFNLLEPSGFDFLKDWHFRFSEGLLGLLVIIVSYCIAYQLTNKRTAELTALLLSTNNYLVWLGRILHREMILTFCFSLFVFYLYKSIANNRHIWLASLSLGSALLVKETAILLFPLLFFLKRPQNLLIILIISGIIFSPVLSYNLMAYLVTGYADVFFSNIFGVFRPGATPRDPLILNHNLISISSYLIDIFSPGIFVSYSVSFITTLKLKKIWLLHLWICSTLIFFSFTAIRGYYFVFLAIPSSILLIIWLTSLPRKLTILLFSTIFIYSSLYTLNTHIFRSDLVSEFPTAVDGNIIVPTSLFQTHSKVAISWAYNHGLKKLVTKLQLLTTSDSCFTFDSTINHLQQRRYFWTQDQIKSHYLGIDYPTRFPTCTESTPNHYLITKTPQLNYQITATIADSAGQAQFYIYQTR